jgi:hypothetical protein
MYDGAGFNAVQRSVRWAGCYDYYNLQETGRPPKPPPCTSAAPGHDPERLLDLSGELLQGARRVAERPDTGNVSVAVGAAHSLATASQRKR